MQFKQIHPSSFERPAFELQAAYACLSNTLGHMKQQVSSSLPPQTIKINKKQNIHLRN